MCDELQIAIEIAPRHLKFIYITCDPFVIYDCGHVVSYVNRLVDE